MTINVYSTTDTEEQVLAATGGKKEVTESKSEPAEEAEAKEPTESDTEETKESKEEPQNEEESEDESSDESDEESEDEDSDEDEKPKKRKESKGVSRRLKRLHSRYGEQLSAKDQEIERLKAQLEGNAPKEETPKQSTQAEGKPSQDDFETHEEWIEAVAEWKAEKLLEKRETESRQKKEQERLTKIIDDHRERLDAYADENPEFADEVSEVIDFNTINPVLDYLLAESENGPMLMHELAKDPDAYDRINGIKDHGALQRAFGRFEAKVESKTTPSKTEKKTKPKTKAPRPLSPVSGGSGSAEKSIYDPNLSQSEYEALMAKRENSA
tara:strand:- start:3593 stop:4573 length:981 start_codon:yes stop_codon:yes gene_type:complete